jgi:nicotinamidase-related amidase
MTSHPKSLLQIAGAPLHPSALEKSALIIIDAQLEYVTGNLPLAGVDAAIRELTLLLSLARHAKVPVSTLSSMPRLDVRCSMRQVPMRLLFRNSPPKRARSWCAKCYPMPSQGQIFMNW